MLSAGNVVEIEEVSAQYWRVERIEDEREFAPTASEVEADPLRRCGTAYLRPDPNQEEWVPPEQREAKV